MNSTTGEFIGEFRAVVEATTDKYQELVDLIQEALSSIEQELSGVVAWEMFGDAETGTVLIQEVFVDKDAANAYEEFMESKGSVDSVTCCWDHAVP